MAAAAARRGAHSTGAAMHNHPKQGCSCELMGNQSQNNWASCCSIKVRSAWIPSSTSWLFSLDSCSPYSCPCPSLCYWQYKQPQSWLLSVRARGKSCSFCTDQMQYYHKEKENAASSFCSEHPVTSSDWPSCCLLLAVCICLEMCLGKVFFFSVLPWKWQMLAACLGLKEKLHPPPACVCFSSRNVGPLTCLPCELPEIHSRWITPVSTFH